MASEKQHDVVVAESELSKKLEISEDEELENEDSESKLFSLISRISQVPRLYEGSGSDEDEEARPMWESMLMPLIIQTISLVGSMDFDSQPKPETKLMSLVTQTVSLFDSTDLDSLPKPLRKLISLISQKMAKDSDSYLYSLIYDTLTLKPEPELVSLIRQIVSVVVESMNPELRKLISLCPQVEVFFDEGKFSVYKECEAENEYMWSCFVGDWEKFRSKRGEDATYFHCRGCNGEYHNEYEKAPVKIKHHLHPKHSLMLVMRASNGYSGTRKCYCCDEDLKWKFYYCSTCDYAMNIACVEKPRASSIPPTKWHEHELSLFPSQASLPCNVCALTHSACPFYICPPCDFVVHQRCLNLPRVIRISRHPHRIHFTPSFDQGDWSCRICRRKIDNDYGGYSCIKNDCSYAAHSRCATLKKVWDGIDLDGQPEENEEVVEPFVREGDGIIRHFSHEHHQLRLDDSTSRDYDENRQCQACITPIYFNKFYSCVQCEFVLHETCANLSRKIYHPIHPHQLTLVPVITMHYSCSAEAHGLIGFGFCYECSKEECGFRVHTQCATISEPLVHKSHNHLLFLTEEMRLCSVCQTGGIYLRDTFNCIECDDFALCFTCAVIPQKVRYKHDKHILTLSYGEETSTMTYWCEACETKINPKEGFYVCSESCCVTLHIKCLIGGELYMKPDSSFKYIRKHVRVLPNNHHMTRPICSKCEKRCSDKIVIQYLEAMFCSLSCVFFYKKLIV